MRPGEPPCRQCVVAAQCPVAIAREASELAPPGAIVTRSHRRHALLQRQGERSSRLAFVKSGLLAVRRTGPDGRDLAIGVIGQGNLLGQSEISQRPAMFSVQALTPVAVCEFRIDLLQVAAQLHGQSVLALKSAHASKVVGTLADWSRLVRLPNLDQRFALALLLIADMQTTGVTQLPAQGALAELMAVARESINRLWRDFLARGLVRRRHHHGVDLNREQIQLLLMASD